MPKLSKKAKIEWSLFIGENGRRQYNELCRKCRHGYTGALKAPIRDNGNH